MDPSADVHDRRKRTFWGGSTSCGQRITSLTASVEATNWYGVFVADFASERARLRKAKMMCFGRRAATYDAGLPRYKFAVFLIAQTDRLTWQASSAADGFLRSLRECVFVTWACRALGNGRRDFDSLASGILPRHGDV